MDLSTIIGLLLAFGLIIVGMGSGVAAFIDVPSALIVIGGTIGVSLTHYRFPEIMSIGAIYKKTFSYAPQSPTELIGVLVEYAKQARREGILALESAANNTEDPFLKRALQMAVDGHEVDSIETILSKEIEQLKERHKAGADILGSLAGYAPAMGMIGTLVGLVLMLQNMDDPSTIGPSMAVALLTTFYGALIANLLCNPVAGKLKSRSSEEVLYKELTMNGVLSISLGDNPRIVEQKLLSYLAPKQREEVDNEGSGE